MCILEDFLFYTKVMPNLENLPKSAIVLADLENFPKSLKLSALYQDEFEIPIFLHILQSGIDQSDILHDHGKSQTMHGFCNDSVRILHGSKRKMEPFRLSGKPLNLYVLKQTVRFYHAMIVRIAMIFRNLTCVYHLLLFFQYILRIEKSLQSLHVILWT